jgi:hypothetical protein
VSKDLDDIAMDTLRLLDEERSLTAVQTLQVLIIAISYVTETIEQEQEKTND